MIVAYTKADVIEYMGVITEHVDMDHPVPVSYTHLDVYKRQVQQGIERKADYAPHEKAQHWRAQVVGAVFVAYQQHQLSLIHI